MEATPTIPPECLEWRRFRALDLKRRGWIQRDIAEALDASEVTVSRWLARPAKAAPRRCGRDPRRVDRPGSPWTR
jgi:transposase